jgi:hypothetical protein
LESYWLDQREFNPLLLMPMPKKKKPSAIPDDPVSRKSLQDGIKELLEKNFAVWNPSLTEEALFQIAEGLEQVAKVVRNLAASGKLPAK